MYNLNLPPTNLNIKKKSDKKYVFDRLRKQYVCLTPEEWVRQHFINYLIRYKNYPEGLLTNEIHIKVGKIICRCDTVLYNISLRAQMIIEYKSPITVLTRKCFEQIIRYNMNLKVSWLIISNGMQHYCCRINKNGEYTFLKKIPEYSDL
ncbi:MAG: type I restriction enzyme HsdR N-terminal domain-containing protein [Bacteroidales bacterium OttesenSCG-928-I14]|jgi:hypothetical protein|nr:type I restriction enzyme HsdR N-terminal domain-containing protein [Bacteroidales bacterium OttesenSCG-928-I14]